jgi:hypothetical protein
MVVIIFFLFVVVVIHFYLNSSKASRSMTFKTASPLENPAQTEIAHDHQSRELTPTILRVIPLTRQEKGAVRLAATRAELEIRHRQGK